MLVPLVTWNGSFVWEYPLVNHKYIGTGDTETPAVDIVSFLSSASSQLELLHCRAAASMPSTVLEEVPKMMLRRVVPYSPSPRSGPIPGVPLPPSFSFGEL